MNLGRPVVLWIGALVVVAAALVVLRDILLPFVAGMALAYLLDPLVGRIERLGVNRGLATLAIMLLFIGGVGALAIVTVPVVIDEVSRFIESIPGYMGRMQALADDPGRPWVRKVVGEALGKADQSAGELASTAASWAGSFLRSLWSSGQALLSTLSLLVVTPIVTFYLIYDWKRVVASLDRSIPEEHRGTARALAKEIDETIATFLRGQGTICLILGVLYAAALGFMGLNHGLMIGFLSGFLAFMPYVGSLTGLVLSLAVVALQFGADWARIAAVVGIFFVGQSIADYALAPFLIGSRVHLHPVWVIFAVFAFGYLFGFVGLLVAVPLAAAIGVTVRFAQREYEADRARVPPP